MATVPQNVILNIAFLILLPPTFAAIDPNTIRNIMAKPYCKYSILDIEPNTATKTGNKPPKVKEAPEESAACNGWAWVISLIPNSSRACVSKALCAVNSVAISADGEYIAAGDWWSSSGKKVYLFHKNSSTPLWNYTTGSGVVSVAIGGVVMCRVDASAGAIRAGDLLIAGTVTGHACRSDDPAPGTVLGKALGTRLKGRGMISVLLGVR